MKKKKTDAEQMTAEEALGYYFIADFTSGGMPIGISMEEADKIGLLDEEDSTPEDTDLPF